MAATNRMPPVHPGEILREEMDELGLSPDALAQALDGDHTLDPRRGYRGRMRKTTRKCIAIGFCEMSVILVGLGIAVILPIAPAWVWFSLAGPIWLVPSSCGTGQKNLLDAHGASEHLRTPEDVAAYLNAAIEESGAGTESLASEQQARRRMGDFVV